MAGQVPDQYVSEDRAEDRRAERPADRAEERGARGRDASSLCGTPFCTMMTSTCMTPPMPMPSTSMYRASSAVDVCTPIRCSRNRPTVMNPAPAIGKNRYLPVLEMIWPDEIETRSSPAISGSRYTPEMVGEMPRTTWKKAGR